MCAAFSVVNNDTKLSHDKRDHAREHLVRCTTLSAQKAYSMLLHIISTFSRVVDQPGMVANPSRGQLNRHNYIFLSPFAPGNLASRNGFDRVLRPQLTHSPPSGWIWRLLARFLPLSSTVSTYYTANRNRVSLEFIMSRKCAATNDVLYRESAGSGPVVLTVVPVTGSAWI